MSHTMYLEVAIHPHYHWFVQFQWQGSTYQFKCLPYGLSAAPQVFTKLLKSLVVLLFQVRTRLIVLEAVVAQICQLFEVLGLMLNRKSSHLSLDQHWLPSVLNHFETCDSKRVTLKDPAGCTPPPAADCSACEGVGKVHREDSCHSESSSSSPLTLQSFTEIDELGISLTPCQPDMVAKFITQVQLPQEAKVSSTWWVELTLEEVGTAILSPTLSLVLESDASNMGWGATNGEKSHPVKSSVMLRCKYKGCDMYRIPIQPSCKERVPPLPSIK